jgi:hypothetical protein
MGIPIAAHIGQYGGYQLQPGFKLPQLLRPFVWSSVGLIARYRH